MVLCDLAAERKANACTAIPFYGVQMGENVEYLFRILLLETDAVHPVCTHMHCDVKWNSAEKSWNCPCHGVRYDVDGNVLTGPADRALESMQISKPAAQRLNEL